jgi:ribosomal protein S10
MTASIAQQKIRIRLKAFDRRMLDLSCGKSRDQKKPKKQKPKKTAKQ